MEEDLKKQLEELKRKVQFLENKRITQQQIVPDSIKSRAMGEPNRFFLSGVAADRPSPHTVTGGVTYYFATDTNTLYVYNGTAWKSVLLS